ncbi:MAG: hypothetical protein K2M63_04055 [Muribaculaceae bacterium]|nr:hypothetical protein [Muribaculaceae bacterium]
MANIIQISLFRNKKGRNFLHRITLFPYISLFPNSCSQKGARPLSSVKHRRDNTKAVAESSRRRHGYSHSLTTLLLYCHCCIAEEAPHCLPTSFPLFTFFPYPKVKTAVSSMPA